MRTGQEVHQYLLRAYQQRIQHALNTGSYQNAQKLQKHCLELQQCPAIPPSNIWGWLAVKRCIDERGLRIPRSAYCAELFLNSPGAPHIFGVSLGEGGCDIYDPSQPDDIAKAMQKEPGRIGWRRFYRRNTLDDSSEQLEEVSIDTLIKWMLNWFDPTPYEKMQESINFILDTRTYYAQYGYAIDQILPKAEILSLKSQVELLLDLARDLTIQKIDLHRRKEGALS